MLAQVMARLRGDIRRLNVYGVCPPTGVHVPTHAYMTESELRRFDRSLALFCPACRRAHQFTRTDLSLDRTATPGV